MSRNDNVIPFQSLLFLKQGDNVKSGTLSGNKKKVYVILKLMKKCYNADITSFKVNPWSLYGKDYNNI